MNNNIYPRQIDFPDEYCGWCCHYHNPDTICGVYQWDGTINGDNCSCSSTLEDRERLLREVDEEIAL